MGLSDAGAYVARAELRGQKWPGLSGPGLSGLDPLVRELTTAEGIHGYRKAISLVNNDM